MSYNLLRVLGWMPGVGIGQNIVGGQLVNILIYLFILIPLYILKPKGFFRRLMVMIGAMLVAVFLFNALTVAAYANHPEEFGGHVVPPQLILFQTVIGFFTIWFFVLAERSLLAEEDLAKEETKRLSYEKQLLEDRLVLLQAQIEPMLLLQTMKTIEGLYGTDPKRATTLQMHFIQYVRALLVKTRKQATTVEQEMELIRAFIKLCNMNAERKLTCRFDIDPETKALSFPSMLIQPIVEYSLQNGPEADSRESEMTISVHKRGQTLQIVISNSTSCRADTNSYNSVFSLIRERLHSLFGDNAKILQLNSPRSTLIEIPYDAD